MTALLSLGLWLGLAAPAAAYPLDGRALSGIRRLDGYRAAQEQQGPRLPPGALLASEDIRLSLAGKNTSWDLAGASKDPTLQASLESVFADRDPSYGVAVIDITDPERVVWAGVREDRSQYPGSVGKVLCMAALFDSLARAYPDVEDRRRILRETVIQAGAWAAGGSHTVPKYDAETGRNRFATLAAEDRFTLAEWIDHMVSPSANGAGAIVWREAMLLRHFGAEYPVTPDEVQAFLKQAGRGELQKLSQQVIDEPLARAGLDLDLIQQGTFWTGASQAAIPGLPSFATPRELARLLLRLEQGRLVDEWSSLEMKRFLYMTKKRYRYVYAPELGGSAVYFKSGSLYQCTAEKDFKCGKYRGNVKNFMNSIVIVESPARGSADQRRYIVALMSNVLRKNSAWDHARLGAAIEQAVRTRKAVEVDERGSASELSDAGKSD